jgi:hypothetical protein
MTAMDADGLIAIGRGLAGGLDRTNLPNDQPLEPGSFRQKVSISDGFRLEFDLRRDSRL